MRCGFSARRRFGVTQSAPASTRPQFYSSPRNCVSARVAAGYIGALSRCRHYEAWIETVEKFGGNVGMSHIADGDSTMINGTEVIEQITEVHSIDVVMNPATARGLFESVGGGSLNDLLRQAVAMMSEVSTAVESYLADGGALVMNAPVGDGNAPCHELDGIAESYPSAPSTYESFEARFMASNRLYR